MATLKSPFLTRKTRTKPWRDFLVILESEASYAGKLQAIFTLLDEHLGMAAYCLYLLNREGNRLFLEHFRTTEKTGQEPGFLVTGDTSSDSVRSTVGSPPLQIPYSKDCETVHLIPTGMGQLLSIPVRVDGELRGVLQTGPINNQNMVRRVERLLHPILFPFCLSVVQARRTQDLLDELTSVQARSDVSRKILSSAFEVNKFISLLLELSLKATGTEAGFVAIAQNDSAKLVIRAAQNIPADFLREVDLFPGSGLFDWLSETDKSLIVRDWEFAQRKKIKSILAVPLLAEAELLGIFVLVNFEREETFADYSLRLLKDFSEQIRLVLDNARLLELFTDRYLRTLKALSRSVDVRFPSTLTHSERVARTAVMIAQKMKLPPVEIETMETAGLIHDVGMCGVTEVAKGFRADYNHPTIGASMIEFLTLPVDIAGFIRTHHEWYDGWGFPEGLKEEEIPLGGRILALAEFFVESTTSDEIRLMMDWNKVSSEIAQRRGSQFDPEIVDAFLELISELRDWERKEILQEEERHET